MEVYVGSYVEVCSNEDGFLGSYYEARVVSRMGKEKFTVEYTTLLADDQKGPLKGAVRASSVRPVPPKIRVSNFNVLDKVDAYDLDGWWVGRVTGRKGDSRYSVYFDSSGDEFDYPSLQKLHLYTFIYRESFLGQLPLGFTMQTRTVQVGNLSDLANEREIHEFFSFSGDIEHIEIRRDSGQSKTAFVTFKDPKALEIALLLSGATIVDQIVGITAAENYVPKAEIREVRIVDNVVSEAPENIAPSTEAKSSSPSNGRVYVSKAQDVVSSMLAKGSAMGQDAMNKAKAFDEKHQLTANASAKVISFDRRVGLTEKLTVGISVVNEKMKSVDQKLQVSDKTMAALMAAERKLNDTGSAVKSSRYVTAGTSWFNGAFSKVAKAGQVAGTKTREKWNLAVSNLTAKDPPIAV